MAPLSFYSERACCHWQTLCRPWEIGLGIHFKANGLHLARGGSEVEGSVTSSQVLTEFQSMNGGHMTRKAAGGVYK